MKNVEKTRSQAVARIADRDCHTDNFGTMPLSLTVSVANANKQEMNNTATCYLLSLPVTIIYRSISQYIYVAS